jgi:histidyl-tRNA synthetase
MRDILPTKMILREHVVTVIEQVFAEYGFEPLITPSVELADVLFGKYGPEAEKLFFMVEHRGGKEKLGLRYDLSVPLSRLVAQYPDLPKPFRRYQIAPVWRAERPQRGRYREFWQCDADIVGSDSMLADAEIIAVTRAALARLGFRDFVIRLNDRKILTGIGQYAGVPKEHLRALHRSIDKLDKIGVEAVRRELDKAGLDVKTVDRLLQLLRPASEAGGPGLDNLRRELAGYPTALEGIDELKELLSYLPALDVAADTCRVDLSMVRGLDYYTGPIFETVVERPKIGSVSGGGRYDGLIGTFSKRGSPATGTSIGLERILDVMEELDMFSPEAGGTLVQVLVTVFSPELLSQSLGCCTELRSLGLHCELYYGTDPLGTQIRYALKRGIPLLVILGPDELEAGQAVARDLRSKSQVEVTRSELASVLRRWLDGDTA